MSSFGSALRAARPGARWLAWPVASALVLGGAGLARAETLSAEDAVRRAARGNPALRAALSDASAARHAARAEAGARDPNFVASVEAEHSETITRPGLSGIGPGADAASRAVTSSLRAQAALTYTTDIGTRLELGTRTGSSWNATSFSGTSPLPDDLNVGPTYSAQAYAGVEQPLLRGAGAGAELAPLRLAEASARAADHELEDAASQTALDVLSAYWDLWYADRAVEVQRQALEVAQRLVEDARLRASTLGTGSAVDVLQFTTSAASIADALSQARAERDARAIELGRLLGMEPGEAGVLGATGSPPRWGPVPGLDALTAGAVEAPALRALREEVERGQVRVRAASNAARPRLDAFATASVGTLWDEGSSFSLTGGRPTFSVLGGLELELPIGGGRQASDAAAASAELEAAEARYRAELQAARARVSSLAVNARAAGEQIELASQTALAAGQLAQAERQRLALGTTTSRDVVSAEQTSREAELRRLRAIVSEATARLSLEHATGTLLERYAARPSTGRSS